MGTPMNRMKRRSVLDIVTLWLVVALASTPVWAQYELPATTVYADTALSGQWRGNVVTSDGQRYAVMVTINAYSDGQCDVRYDVAGVTSSSRAMRTASCDHMSLLFVDDSTGGAFSGRLLSGQDIIDGTWELGRTRSPLRLYNVSRPRERAQDVEEAPPYLQRDLLIPAGSSGNVLGATITVPDSVGTWPLFILVSDRGPDDRDSRDASGHRPFRVIADYYTKQGWAVLRYDDRGTGLSTGAMAQATEQVTDLVTVLDRVRRLPNVDAASTVLVGHGEGGVVALQAAVQRPDMILGVVCAATPALEGRAWITEYVRVSDDLVGIDEDISQAAATMVGTWYDVATNEQLSVDEQVARIGMLTDSLLEAREELLGAYSVAAQLQRPQRDQYIRNRLLPWLQSYQVAAADSVPSFVQSLDRPVLALIAGRDALVPSELNEQAWKNIQQQSATTTVIRINDVNHGFQPCTYCTDEEAAHATVTIDEGVLQQILTWSNQQRQR